LEGIIEAAANLPDLDATGEEDGASGGEVGDLEGKVVVAAARNEGGEIRGGIAPLKVGAALVEELHEGGVAEGNVGAENGAVGGGEAEFNRKLLRPGKRLKNRLNLNIDDLLRANMDSTANYVSKMFQCGGYTVNELRAKIGQPKVKGGDKAYAPMNLIPVDAPITQNKQVDKNIKVGNNGEGN
jgi:hypothetical protein